MPVFAHQLPRFYLLPRFSLLLICSGFPILRQFKLRQFNFGSNIEVHQLCESSIYDARKYHKRLPMYRRTDDYIFHSITLFSPYSVAIPAVSHRNRFSAVLPSTGDFSSLYSPAPRHRQKNRPSTMSDRGIGSSIRFLHGQHQATA